MPRKEDYRKLLVRYFSLLYYSFVLEQLKVPYENELGVEYTSALLALLLSRVHCTLPYVTTVVHRAQEPSSEQLTSSRTTGSIKKEKKKIHLHRYFRQ